MGKSALLLIFLLTLPSCGERQTEYGSSTEVRLYLDELKEILLQLRSLEKQLGQAVPSDTVDVAVIVPLIENRFRPALTNLHEKAMNLTPQARLDSVHQRLLAYLELRIKAYDLILEGARQGKPELFDESSSIQFRADDMGRRLESDIRGVRNSLR